MVTALRSWTIHTLAGTGEPGYTGDGGPCRRVALNEPKGLTVDSSGNLVIADSENHVIRRLDRATGVITTVAGVADAPGPQTGVLQDLSERPSMAEDPFAETASTTMQGYKQQADLSGTVRYFVNGTAAPKRFSGDGGPAVQARLNFPTAVVVDRQGNVYIADTMNHRVRVVDAATGIITTIAGVGQPRYGGDGGLATAAGLNEPAALALNGRGTLYIADQSNNRIRAVDLATGQIRTVAGTGVSAYDGDGIPATEAALAGPSGLACGEDDTLFIADTFSGRIRAIDPVTGLIRTVVGDGGEYRYRSEDEAPSASLSRPSGIAVDRAGNLLLTDSDNHLVRRWDGVTGLIERVSGGGATGAGGDGGLAVNAELNYPFGIAVDGEGRILIADTFNHRIREITP